VDEETQDGTAEDGRKEEGVEAEVDASSAPGSPSKVPFVEPIAAGGRVIHVDLEEIDMENEDFRFRFALRLGALRKSLARDGQQLPVVLRRVRQRGAKYQIISGFRRVTAISELGWTKVAAIVRDDLDDDAAALRASVLENTARKTYSDIDRAYVIRSRRSDGQSLDDLAELMCLSKKQVTNLEALVDLPVAAQDAIDDPDVAFHATHALILRRFANVHGDDSVDWPLWISKVVNEGLSVSKLTRALNATLKDQERPPVGSIFRDSDGLDKGVVHLNPIKFDITTLSDEEKATLRAEFEGILRLL